MKAIKRIDRREIESQAEDPETVPMANTEVAVYTESTAPRMLRIRFFNLRDPGRELKFFLHTATHPLHHYTLFHDREYDLPEEVVHHLEGMGKAGSTCMVPIRKDRLANDGIQSESYIHSWKSLFQCKFIKQL